MTYEQFQCEVFDIYTKAREKWLSGEKSLIEAQHMANDDIDALIAEAKFKGAYEKEWLSDAQDAWEYINNGEE